MRDGGGPIRRAHVSRFRAHFHKGGKIWITMRHSGSLNFNAQTRRPGPGSGNRVEVLAMPLPNEQSRRLAQLQAKANHKLAKDFRELAQKVKES